MATRDEQMLIVEATATWTKALEAALAKELPIINSDEQIRNFTQLGARDQQPHAAIHLRNQLLANFLIAALKHATDENDPAFSVHADKHTVSSEAAQILTSQLVVNSQQIRVVESVDRRSNHPVPRYVVDGEFVERTQNLQPYIILGGRLEQIMDRLSSEEKQKWYKQIFKELLQQCGVSFAVLCIIRAGANPTDVLEWSNTQDLQQLKTKSKLKIPSQKRNGDFTALKIIADLLFYTDDNGKIVPIFDLQKQTAAISLAERQWGEIGENLKKTRVYVSQVKPRAVFESLTKTAVKIAEQVAPQFGGRAKTNWLEKTEGYITSQLVTIFLIHQHPIENVAGKAQEITRRELADLTNLPTSRTAAAQTDP